MIKHYITTVEYEDIRFQNSNQSLNGKKERRMSQYGKSWYQKIKKSSIPILRDFANILWEKFDQEAGEYIGDNSHT